MQDTLARETMTKINTIARLEKNKDFVAGVNSTRNPLQQHKVK